MEIRDRIKELRRVPASALQPNPKNWRRHPQAQNAALLGILEDVGYAGAVLARESADGSLVLIDGHARAGLTPDAVIPTLILDVTEAEADRLLASFDPIGAMAEMDRQALGDLLTEIGDVENERLSAFFDDLRTGLTVTPAEGHTDPDAAPPLPAEPQSRVGDLWLMGRHRLLCGDATNDVDVARLMQGTQASALWTDPPYGVNYEGGTADKLTLQGDKADGLEYLLSMAFSRAEAAVEPGAPFYICRPGGNLSVTFGHVVLESGWQFHQELIWVKDALVLGHSDYHFRHETLIYGWLPGEGRSGRGKHAGSRWYGDNAQTSVFEIPRPKASPDHPTAKPVELIERCLDNSTSLGAIVYEPFLGSGSTLLACERLGRACYALDIDPRYCDVAVQRWEAYTGQTAKLATGGG